MTLSDEEKKILKHSKNKTAPCGLTASALIWKKRKCNGRSFNS